MIPWPSGFAARRTRDRPPTPALLFLPFAVDAAVVILTARRPELAPLHVGLATAGSLLGGAVTFWLGSRAGEHGLERLVSKRRLECVRRRVKRSGAVALALPALMPPRFPLTPFVLACGALKVSRTRFFATLAVVRALRFGVEAAAPGAADPLGPEPLQPHGPRVGRRRGLLRP